MTSSCRSCGAPIRWAKTPKGKPTPLDLEPVPDGTIRLGLFGGEELALVLTDPAEIAAAQMAGPLYKSHFATCPNADMHRRPYASKRTAPVSEGRSSHDESTAGC